MPTSLTPIALGESRRILVVDDDTGILNLEAIALELAGHRVDKAADGERAWKALLVGNYDLLVTGYVMPGVSGLALARRLRVADMMLPIVMVSGNLREIDASKISNDPWTRIDAFLAKPFKISELLSVVNRALGVATTAAKSEPCGARSADPVGAMVSRLS